ncbi:hypothetical protein SAMN05216404_106198 [Nitrosospira multiformis]|uniref:Uncharacterized protein n=1 Tax=Nitrosospira multiformis TaxID=1231 RepID=A0A1H8IX71_9PROT|nr:hypothetical protein [Nitrosospira multiformis]SEN72537.1 hypothetical protein SAMN05216404_106198 [Nitrosospira multiformis]
MSNEFNLERAKAGEPVEFRTANGYVKVQFVGMHGPDAVIYWQYGYTPVDPQELRIAPKKVNVRYRVAVMKNNQGDFYTIVANHDDEAELIKGWTNFKRWLSDWQEVEVTE